MIPRTFSVTPNVTLSHIQTHRFKTGVLSFTLPLPLTRENWCLNSLLSGVLRQGTESYPTISALNKRLDQLYAACLDLRCQALGNNLTLSLTAELLDDEYAPMGAHILEGVLDLVQELLYSPKLENGLFRSRAVEQEIRFATDAIRGEINNTRAYSVIRLSELMHRNDPNHLTLKEMESSISSITPQTLTDFYRQEILTAPLRIFYVGSADSQLLVSLLKRRFDRPAAKGYVPLPPIAEQSAGFLEKKETMPVSQGKLAMGFRTGVCLTKENDRTPVMLVLNEIFGGSPASKLFLNLREKMNLCYYCSSAYQRYNGILSVSSGIDSNHVTLVKDAVLSQLREIQEGHVSDWELAAAQSSLENYCRSMTDNPLELQAFYGSREFFGIDDTTDSYCRALREVTKEQVVELSRQIFLDTVFFIEGEKNLCKEVTDDEE